MQARKKNMARQSTPRQASRRVCAYRPEESPFCGKNEQRLSRYCDEWLRMRRIRVKESTFVKYGSFLEKYIKPRMGDYAVTELTADIIDDFSWQLLEQDGLSPKTVRDILTVLHGVLQYAADHSPEPVADIRITYPHAPRKEIRVLSREEQRRLGNYLIQSLDPCKFGTLLSLMTGMRIGELCALRWKDISLEDRAIRVRATMQRLKDLDQSIFAKTRVIISTPKSSCGFRFIPLTDQAAALCAICRCFDPEAFVLTGSRDSYLEPRAMQYRFRKYTAACGLEGVHFHTLRHTFATRCVEVGFEIKALSEIMGHSSPKITLERYVHASVQLKRDNMSKLAAVGL